MGTDRSEIHSGPCVCGKGEFVINFCTPDHPWPTQSKWFETEISCKSCSKEYALVKQGKHFVVVRKGEINKSQQLLDQYHEESRKIMQLPEVIALNNSLRELLETQKSIAACHRLLSFNGLDFYSIGTFRKHWQGPAHWVKNNVRASNLDKVMKTVGAPNPQLITKLQQIERLYGDSKKPLAIIGNPLVDISHYQY